MSNLLRQLFEAAMSREANPYLAALGTKAQPQPPMQPMDVAGMASPQVGMGMALAQSFQQPLPQSPGEWWGRMQQQGQAMLDPSQAPLMLLGKIGPTPAAFSGALQGTKVLNKRGVPRMTFHGTPVAWEGPFDVNRSTEGLYGRGIYFTESPVVAGGSRTGGPLGYATGETTIRRYPGYSKKEIRQDIAAEPPSSGLPIGASISRYWNPMRRADEKAVKITYSRGTPNVRPAYLNIRRPFDVNNGWRDASEIAGADIRNKWRGSDITAYDALQSHLGLDKDGMTAVLKANGFDGLTHIGGVGERPHRVWIAFDPEQIIPAYGPKVGQGSFQRATK